MEQEYRTRMHAALDRMLDARKSSRDGGPGAWSAVKSGAAKVGNFVSQHATDASYKTGDPVTCPHCSEEFRLA